MAVTSVQNVTKKGNLEDLAFPVKASEYIYQGALAVVESDGYLYNLTSARAANGSQGIVVIIKDGSENNNATAPSADGSLSGSRDQQSDLSNGEKTVRQGWIDGIFRISTASGLTQASVGRTLYASDNLTFNDTGDGIAVGEIVQYISATECWINLNSFKTDSGTVIQKGVITAATTTTGGDAISWSPGVRAYLTGFHIDVTTEATGAATMDVGIAANGTTTSDTLIDGVDVGTAAIYATPYVNGGTNGAAPRLMTATQYVTGTPSATLAGLVGVWVAEYIKA